MAKTINPSKLLPSAKSTAIIKIGQPKPINFITKTSSLSKGLLAKRENKDPIDANNKLVKVDKFLKSDLIVSKKKAEVKRKDKEKQDFAEAEKKLETPQSKKFKLPGISVPSLGFMDRVKRFIFFTALGWALPKILEFLPKLEGFAKIVGGVYQFAEGLFGKLFDGFMSLVKFGGDLKDKTLGFIAQVSGGDAKGFEKKFSELEKQFNNFANLSIIAGLVGLDMGIAAVDEYNKWKRKSEGAAGAGGRKLAAEFLERKLGRKLTPQELKELGVKPGSVEGRAIQRPGTQAERAAAKQQRRIQGAELRAAAKKPEPKPSLWQKLTGGLKSKFAGVAGKLAKPFSKFAGAAIPGLGAAIGFADAQARSKSGDKLGAFLAGLSASLDAFTAAVAVAGLASAATGVGLPAAAVLATAATAAGAISMSIDVVLLIRDILKAFGVPVFNKGGRVVRKYQGGGTTRGGRPVGAPKRRGITPRRRRTVFKLTPPKSQPGKDIGGEKEIKKLYPDPDKMMTMDEFNRSPMGQGSYNYNMYKDDFKKRTKKPNPYKALTGTAKILKDIPLVGGIMGAAVDIVLGQKPDVRVYRTLSAGIGSLVESLANQKTNQSVTSLMKEIKGFSEGGNVPVSRELKGDYRSLSSGDMIAKVLGPTIDQRVNEAIQSIQKELKLKGGKGKDGGGPPGPPGPDDTPGARLRDGSNAQIEADLLEYFTALYGKNAAIGIVANLRRETSGYRTATPDNTRFEGMAQLSRNDRWPKFVKWAENKGLNPYDRNAQAQYVAVELKQLGTDKRIVKAKTPEEAASIFYNEFERGAHSKPVKGNSYNPDNPHENKNKDFIKDITKSNPDIGKRANDVVIMPTVSPGKIPKADYVKGVLDESGEPGFDVTWKGDNNIAILPGKVKEVGQLYGANYGNVVVVESVDPVTGKKVDVLYAHFPNGGISVRPGQQVGTGQVLGRMGKPGEAGVGNITGQHASIDFYQPNSNAKYSRWDGLSQEIISSAQTGNNPSNWPKPQPKPAAKPGQQPPQASNPNIINASGLALGNLQERISKLKTGQKIVFNNVGSIQSGKNWLGQPEIKYYNSEGDNIGKDKFVELFRNSDVRKQMEKNNSQARNFHGGGIIPSKPNRPIPNSFAPYETYGSGMMIAIQPIIVEKQVPVSGGGNKMIAFPVPVAVNSNMNNAFIGG